MSDQTNTVLTVTVPNQPPRCYAFEGEQVRIGRGRSCHIRIEHEAISNTHCEFIRSANFPQWRFRDLGSTNGSLLNGESTNSDACALKDGDEILLGNAVKLHFLVLRELEVPEEIVIEEEDPLVNPVAAAVARQGREDMEGTQLISLRAKKRKQR